MQQGNHSLQHVFPCVLNQEDCMCSGLERRRSLELKARNLLSLVSQDLGFLHMFRVRSFCWRLPRSQKNKRLLGDFVSLTFRSYTHSLWAERGQQWTCSRGWWKPTMPQPYTKAAGNCGMLIRVGESLLQGKKTPICYLILNGEP